MFWRRKSQGKAASNENTLLPFWDAPLSPPRVPALDNNGLHTLAFPSERDRAQQQAACEAKVLEGCNRGLRSACSLQAARQCGPPPLLRLLGLADEPSWEEREACEQRCMAACLDQRSPACHQHASAFCAEAFAGPVVGSGGLRRAPSSSGGAQRQ